MRHAQEKNSSIHRSGTEPSRRWPQAHPLLWWRPFPPSPRPQPVAHPRTRPNTPHTHR